MSIRKTIAIFIISIALASCQSKENVETIKAETMKIHDIVMADHSKIVNNQMKLDTLLNNLPTLKLKNPEIDTLAEKTKIKLIIEDLVKAEDSMSDWMHNFNADYKPTEHIDELSYYKHELVRISAIDKQYKSEIKKSDAYLKKFSKP
ncbi:hypothetical protein [Pedobacter namyangjuensis]|uniref:hypothetical protein n=1 Tax=Pedobacter namyangjuensis TaxID=600626 RepID=UPI001F06FFDD|nr:hypothetical protein [Pedobacter namyangjuensis]